MAVHTAPRTHSARRTLVSLLLIPMLSLAGLWVFIASITFGNVINNEHYNTATNTIGPSIIGLEQTLETEGALTLAWLGADRQSPALRTQLLQAREATDTEASAARTTTASVRGLLGATGQARLSTLLADLARLPRIRPAVDSGADSPVTAFAAYNTIDSALYGFLGNSTPPADPTLSLMTQSGIAESRAADFTAGAAGLIEGALAAHGRLTEPERVLLGQIVAEQNLEIDDMFALSTPDMAAVFGQVFGSAAYRQLLTAENTILSGPAGSPVPVQSAAFQAAARAVQAAEQSALPQLGQIVGAKSAQLSDSLRTELYLAAGLGLLAIIASQVVAIRFGTRLRRELTVLYDSARRMAEERLPRLVERLRRGDDVDAEAESPPLQPGRITEIADVARAFTAVQRTAVEAAVGQAALRKGVSQVFVSLSLRSQSLLHRQLGMLDEMERATSDPVALGDLFRLDHLTTRMRRHAEGLLILAGSTPGRGWRDPVPVADVLTAAVAEVEDYVRVDVVTDSPDTVAGTAVNDVIHLLAELIENATVYSPPHTRVEVRGESVGHGFAVEVEDRGLGMPAEEIAALNARLAQPPEFDLASTDQLGLFVAARLAQRHGVRISLRQSPYGGTTAIVLLPPPIIVSETGGAPGADGMGEPPLAMAGGPAYGAGAPLHEPRPGGRAPVFALTGRHRRLGSAPAQDAMAGSAPVPVPVPRPQPPESGMPEPGRTRPALPAPAPHRDQPALSRTPPEPRGWFSRATQDAGGIDAQPGGIPFAASQSPAVRPPAPGWRDPVADGTGLGGTGSSRVTGDGSRPGLPRRARGTSLAPQLRAKLGAASGPAGREGTGPSAPGAEAPPGRSPEEASSLLSALQGGWERARVEDLDYYEGEDRR